MKCRKCGQFKDEMEACICDIAIATPSAEIVARELIGYVRDNGTEDYGVAVNFVQNSIESYAEAKVKEYHSRLTVDTPENREKLIAYRAEGFRNAIERAAKMADEHCVHYIEDFGNCGRCVGCECAKEIRAIKMEDK